MTSLRRSGGSGDGGGDSSGSGCGRSSSRCGAIRWGFSGSGQMQLQRRQRETLPPQQIHECGTLRVGRLGVVLAARTSFAQGVDIFALDYDAILTAMYALTIGTEGDCSLCVLPDPGIEATALGASESALPDTAPAEALHTFMLDSGASRCLHLPLFSTNLVSTAALQDAMVTTTTPGAASAQVSASSSVAPPSSCRLLSHQTLLWHHRLGHPSLQCLRGMHSRLLVSGLPRSLPPLPPSPALPCLPCVEGRQRATPHSSSFPPTTAPLQTLHMDVWGPDRVSGQGRGRYFLLVVDDYTRYTTIFPLRSKGEVPYVLIPWIRALRLQLRERFRQDLPVLRLHSDRGGEFSSDLLWDFCHGEGILQSFTLPASPQQNGIAKRRIGSVMEVARTSMIHAAAPHFLWPFAVCYIAHQLNLWSRVSLPETSPTLRWTGKVGDASVFRVWGSRALVRDTSVDKLSTLAIPCIFLGFPFDAPGWQFYHPTSRRVFPSQDVTFDKSVSFYRLFPYRSAPLPPSPLFLAPGPPPVDPLPPQGPAPSGVSQVDPLPGTVPVEVAVDSGAARGAVSRGAEPGGAELGRAESEGANLGVLSLRVLSLRVRSLGVLSLGVLILGQLREWFAKRTCLWSGSAGAGGSAARGTGAGGVGTTRLGGAGVSARVSAGAGGTKGAGAAGPCGARTRGTGAAGTSGVGGAGAGDPRARGARAGGARAGVPRAGGAGTGGARAGGTGAIDPGAGGSGAGVAVSGGTGAGGTVQRRACFVLPQSSCLPPPDSSGSPASVEGECALGTDVLEDRQEDFECLAAAVPHLVAMLLAPEGDSDAPDIPTPRSYAEAITGTYVDAVPPSGAKIVDGTWIFRHSFLVGQPARGDLAAPPTWLHWVISCRYPVEPPAASLQSPPGTSRVAQHTDTSLTTLAALGFAPSFADLSLFLRTDTSLPPFYVLVYVDDLVFATGDTEALALVKSGLQKRHTCTDLGPSALRLRVLLAIVHSSAYRSLALSSTFGRVLRRAWGFVSWRSTFSSSVLSSSCEAEIYGGAMATQELRWLTYVLTDLGEQPRSPLECGQLYLTYVATRANTADIFTKALNSGDHQRFSTVLGLARAPPCPAAREPHCPALQPSASRPATLPSARPTVLHVAPCCSPRVAPYCSPRVALCCPARRALLPCTARALLPCLLRALPCSPRHALPCPAAPPSPAEPRRLARAALPNPSRAALPRSPAPPSRPAAACATAVAGGGAARSVGSAAGAGGAGGSTRSAGGAGGATGSAGGAAGAEGARPNTDHHCLSWPLSRQLQRLGVDSGGHYLSRTTPTLSSFATTPHCRVSTACTPVSLSLAFLGPCPPSRARLPRRAFPASRGGSAPLLTPSSFLRPLLLLQTLHMDVWGPTPIGGTDQERYFMLIVDDYTRSTTIFPLWRKADFSRDFPVMRLHSDRGGEFSSDLLAEFCRDKGIRQSFMLPASPQQNGIVERRIGLIMEVARTSMIHATSPHFLWSFAVRYAAHQLNLWPRISKPETSPTLRWTGKVGNASVFRVWGALSLVCDAKASKLSSCTLRCVFLGFPTDATLWQLYHPRENRVFSSQDVTFDEFVCFHTLHPHASHPVPLAPVFLVPDPPPPVDPLPPQGPAPSGVSQVDPPPLVEPLEISSDSSGLAEGGDSAADDTAATHRSPRLETPPGFPPWLSSPPPQPTAVDSGAETGGAELGGAETEGEGSRDAATGGAATGGAGSGGVVTWGADLGGTASPSGGRAVGDPAGGLGVGQPPQPDLLETLSPQAIRAWIVRRGIPSGGGYGPAGAGASSPRGTAGVGGAGATSPRGATGAEGTRGAAGAGGAGATSPRGATGAGGTRGAAGAGGAGATSPRGATGAGGAGPTSLGGTAGAGGVGGAASAGGAGAGGTGGAGAAGPGGARTRGAGAARAGGATGAAGSGGAGGTAGARGAGAGGNGGAGAAGPGDARVGVG
ncbi:unnamed protein product [Closterium sp. NIES-53]